MSKYISGGEKMKKIIFILFTILFLMETVKADVFYSDYGPFSEYTENYIETSDLTITESERRYKIYKEQIMNGNYYIEGENPNTLPFVDKNNFVETEYSSWNKVKPEEKTNRDILEKTIYEYQNMEGVRYIQMYAIHGSNGGLRIREIEVYNGDEKIPLTFKCYNCTGDENILNDGNVNDNLFIKNDSGWMTIDLNDYYALDNISFKIYLYDDGSDVKTYSIKYTKEEDFASQIFAKGYYKNYFTSNSFDDIYPFITTINDYDIIFPEWEEPVLSEKEVLETKTRKVEICKMYSYRDLKYYYFSKERIYTDGYYMETNEEYPFIDNNIYKDFYRFKTRERIVISDNLKITSYDTKLSDFILESTISDILINGEVDYTKNGFYDVTFELPFQSVQKKVEVSILENDYNLLLKELEEKEKLLDEATSKNEVTEKELNDLLLQIKENEQLIKDYEEQIKSLNNDLSDNKELYKKIETLMKEKEKLEKKVNSLNDKITNLNKKLSDNKILIDDLNNKIKEYKAKEKELNKENKNLEKENGNLLKKQEEYEKQISDMDNLINSLKKQNDEQLEKLNNKNYEELVSKVDIVYNNQNKTINELLNQISLLNSKINNQNNSIDNLIKYNNENANKYKNEVGQLQLLLNEEKDKNHLKNDELNVCLNNEKSILSRYEKSKRQIHQNQILFYIILFFLIVFSMVTLKKINKKF